MSDRAKRIALIACILAIMGFVYASIPQDTTDEIIVNNTNLAPQFIGDVPGTGERVSETTYWANTSKIQIFLFSHSTAPTSDQAIELWINGSIVQVDSGLPSGVAGFSNRSISAIIPKGAFYKAVFYNYHHYVWLEYPIISGRNGTLSINQTIINGGGGASFDGSNVDMNGSMMWNGTFNGTMNHSNLTNLLWSKANHTIDSPLEMNKYNIENITNINVTSGNVFLNLFNGFYDFSATGVSSLIRNITTASTYRTDLFAALNLKMYLSGASSTCWNGCGAAIIFWNQNNNTVEDGLTYNMGRFGVAWDNKTMGSGKMSFYAKYNYSDNNGLGVILPDTQSRPFMVAYGENKSVEFNGTIKNHKLKGTGNRPLCADSAGNIIIC